MKQFLIAAAALSLLGGAAYAQVNANTPGAMASPGSTEGETTATTPADSGMSTGVHSTSSGMQAPAAAPAPAASSMSNDTSSSSTMASNASSPPAAYPVCTSKHEDRCVNRAQATRSARAATRGQKTDNVQPAGM